MHSVQCTSTTPIRVHVNIVNCTEQTSEAARLRALVQDTSTNTNTGYGQASNLKPVTRNRKPTAALCLPSRALCPSAACVRSSRSAPRAARVEAARCGPRGCPGAPSSTGCPRSRPPPRGCASRWRHRVVRAARRLALCAKDWHEHTSMLLCLTSRASLYYARTHYCCGCGCGCDQHEHIDTITSTETTSTKTSTSLSNTVIASFCRLMARSISTSTSRICYSSSRALSSPLASSSCCTSCTLHDASRLISACCSHVCQWLTQR